MTASQAAGAAVGADHGAAGRPGSPLPADIDLLWDRRGELGPGDA